MRHLALYSAIAIAISTPASAQDTEVALTGRAAWEAEVAAANFAYSERDRAIMKIDDTVYLDEGQTAWLMRHEDDRVHYSWTMEEPEDFTMHRDSYVVLVITYSGDMASMLTRNTAENLTLQQEQNARLAEEMGIDMDPLGGTAGPAIEMFAYHEDNESFVFDEGIQLTAYPTQMRPGVTGLRATVFNPNHPEAEHFEGLRWYDYNEDLIIEARFEPMEEFTPITFQTSRGWYKQFYNVGTAVFMLEGREIRMPFYGFTAAPDEVDGISSFFTDAQSGFETYGVGRYIDIEIEAGSFPPEFVTVDFNNAYNPLCARSEFYNCPYAEFDIPLTVAAGEMIPDGDH